MNWKSDRSDENALCGRSILVIEDEPLIALDLESVFLDEGAMVVGPGHSLSEGLALAEEPAISAALLDMRLNGESVGPLAEVLHQRKIPFAFYTGQAEADFIQSKWPSAPVALKPCPARQLVRMIETLCKSAED